MVSVSGFRGRVGDPLTPELVCLLATAFGAFVKRSRDPSNDLPVDILLGRDTRTSGPVLSRAVSAGLVSVGCNVVDLGIVSTPTLMLAVENSDALGGIAVTASHNPAEWNALKLAAPGGTFLDAETMSKFLEFALSEDPPRTPSDELGGVTTDDGASARHLEAVLELPQLNLPALRARAFKVALDCVRGAGATIMPQLLEALGCEVVGINMEMDGLFPRDPEPTAENLTEFADFVRREGADIGLAVDPDVDRLSLVNENGARLGGCASADPWDCRDKPFNQCHRRRCSACLCRRVRPITGWGNQRCAPYATGGCGCGGRGKRRRDPPESPPHEGCSGRGGTRFATSGGRGNEPLGGSG